MIMIRGKTYLVALLVILLPLALNGCALLDWLFGGKENKPPVASFTFSPTDPYEGDTIIFDASGSSDPDGEIASYKWDFGDGTSGDGVITTHAYTTHGTYTVKLTVTDDKGDTGSASRVITVLKKGEPPPPPVNKRPVASFTFSPESPKTGERVTFDASASYDPDGEITLYHWELEKGSIRTGVRVTYIFRKAGSYPVTLTVEDDQGARSSETKTVTVAETPNKPPIPLFTFTPQDPELGEQITFDASASYDPDGSIVSYEWDFGDGTTARGVTATHKFDNPGNYLVTLTVTDDEGASASQTIPIFLTSGEVRVVLDFPSPGPEPRGLAWSGRHLWCADMSGEGSLYKINPSNGNVVERLSSPGIYPLGLAWDGRYLWNIDPVEVKIFQIDPTSGRVVNDEGIDIPGPDPTGLAWGNSHLWVADGETLKIYKLDPSTGRIVDSLSTPGGFPKGLAWDGSHLWLVDMVSGLYRIEPKTGKIVAFYELLPGARAEGLAWDGSHLWLADSEQDKIYKISF